MRKEQMFPTKYLAASDLKEYNQAQGAIVTIESVTEKYFGEDDDAECVFYLKFKELAKPMRLNKSNADVLYERIDDSDEWINTVIRIRPVDCLVTDRSTKKRKEVSTFLVEWPPQGSVPVLPLGVNLTGYAYEVSRNIRRPLPGAAPRAAPPPVGTALPAAPPQGVIGAESAAILHTKIKQRGQTFDGMLRWLYINENATYNMIYGSEAADFPGEAKPGINKFLAAHAPPPPADVNTQTGEYTAPPPAAAPPPPAPPPAAPDVVNPATGAKSVRNHAGPDDGNGVPIEMAPSPKPKTPPPPQEIDVPF